jgi:hypothetical protein
MGSATSGRMVRHFFGAMLALLACAIFVPTRVEAGCLGHVTYASADDSVGRFLDPMIMGDPTGVSADVLATDGPRSPKPCDGPSCSGNKRPPIAPAVTEVRYVEPGAVLGQVLSPAASSSSLLPVSTSDSRLSLSGSGIFHPPRQAERRSVI